MGFTPLSATKVCNEGKASPKTEQKMSVVNCSL